MANLFNSIRVPKLKTNKFNLSHDVKMSGRFGKLMPFMCVPTLPADRFIGNTEALVRFAPLTAPIMHNINVYTHFFFVPMRLVWDNWQAFITGGEDGLESPSYPRIQLPNGSPEPFLQNRSLADYLGFPTVNDGSVIRKNDSLDLLPFKAYQLIWNEYYRDQNLQEEVDIDKEKDGIHDFSSYRYLLQLQNRSWKKDYFTSALPFAQRGGDVSLPIYGEAEVTLTGQNGNIVNGQLQSAQLANMISGVNMNDAQSATINELRRAIKAQEFLETAARGGSRYIEQIFSFFGVRSSDARLQRPQFIGGGKSPVQISDVLQTSETSSSSPQASPSGHALSVQNSHSFNFYCEEHGYIIGIMSIMPQPCYQQGLPRVFSKFDRLDYYWPQFAHLGEQEIKEKEIFYDISSSSTSADNLTFGYTPRYAEYKKINSSVHGDFRDQLSFWHMGRIFENAPLLNSDFLTDVETAANRCFAVQSGDYDKIWINIHNNLRALRKMPKYGTPMF